MKSLKIYSILICLLCASIFKSQIGIGTINPDTSSILEVSSNNKGLLYPRMTTIERLAIPSPAEGLQVFDTDFKCMMLFANSQWACFPRTETLNTSTVSVIQFAGFTGYTGASRIIVGYANISTPTTGTTFQAVTINPSGIIKDSGNSIISTNVNSITINQSGTYLITPSAVFKKNSGSANDQHIKVKINIIKNGSTLISLTYFHLPANGAGVFSASKSSTVLENLTAGDQITFQIQKEAFFDGSGAARTGAFSNILLEVEKLP